MFSQVSVCPQGKGVCMVEGHVLKRVCVAGGMHGGGHVWWGHASHGACVEGACMAGGMHDRRHMWQGGMCGRGHVWQGGMCGRGTCMEGGACVAGGHAWRGGMCGRGCAWQRGHAWQERQPLQLAVRILLECILVRYIFAPHLIIFCAR